MKHEITCMNDACPTVVELPRSPVHRHVQLVEHEQRGTCPVCGKHGTAIVRDVSDEHRFALGQIVATPAALARLAPPDLVDPPREIIEREIKTLVDRHVRGDWGETEDVEVNESALEVHDGCGVGVLMSVYDVRGAKVWVMTEAGRHVTTVMTPGDY